MICYLCLSELKNFDNVIKCDICQQFCHKNCYNKWLSETKELFICPNCNNTRYTKPTYMLYNSFNSETSSSYSSSIYTDDDDQYFSLNNYTTDNQNNKKFKCICSIFIFSLCFAILVSIFLKYKNNIKQLHNTTV